MPFVDAGEADKIPPGRAGATEIGGVRIGLYNVAGQIYAMDDLCTHDHAHLSEGELNVAARTVRCPRHSSHFDLTSGRPKTLPAIRPVRTYESKIENGRIMILVDN